MLFRSSALWGRQDDKETVEKVAGMQSYHTRISLATAGLFISDDEMPQAGDEHEGKPLNSGLGTGLMQMDLYDSTAPPLLPQLPPTAREPHGHAAPPPKPGQPVPLGWGPGPAPDPRWTHQHSRSALAPGPTMGPMGPVASGSNLGSRPNSRPPSVCGSQGGASQSRGGSRASSPGPCGSGRTSYSAHHGASYALGPKEVALLAMLSQGIDLVGEHVASRIHRRLDSASVRVGALEARLACLGTAVRGSLLATQGRAEEDAAKDHAASARHVRCSAQGKGSAEVAQEQDVPAPQDMLHETKQQRVPLSAASANQMQPVHARARGGGSVEAGTGGKAHTAAPAPGTRLPALWLPGAEAERKTAESKTANGAHDAGAPCLGVQAEGTGAHASDASDSLWGGAVVELECEDSETGAQVACIQCRWAHPMSRCAQWWQAPCRPGQAASCKDCALPMAPEGP